MIHAFLMFSKLPFFVVELQRSYQQKKRQTPFFVKNWKKNGTNCSYAVYYNNCNRKFNSIDKKERFMEKIAFLSSSSRFIFLSGEIQVN